MMSTQEREEFVKTQLDGLFYDKKGRPQKAPRPLAPLADTHGHLTSFHTQSPAEVLCRAALAGVRLLIIPIDVVGDFEAPDAPHSVGELISWLEGTIADAHELIDACVASGLTPPAFATYPQVPDLLNNIHIVAGAHPYGARSWDDAARERLRELTQSSYCVGVGEIGLDVGPYNEVPLEAQEAIFREQLRFACEANLPAELHVRDGKDAEGMPNTVAHDLAARVLEEVGMPQRGIDLHCFTQGPKVMAPFVELGCHIAFGGAATFKKSDDIRAAAAACPQELLLSETDCPYMAPVPLRGVECESAMVAFSAACVAQVREETLGVAQQVTFEAPWHNACALFLH